MSIMTLIEKIFNNWQAKLLSFGLAVLLYAAFQIISLDTKSFSIPLQVRSGGNYVLVDDAPEYIRVELQGKPEHIATIQESNIEAYIDTALISTSGKISLPVGLDLAENLTLMEPLEIAVIPASISLNFEENTIAWVPVEPMFAGSPLEGYEVVSWSSDINDVKVVGARSIVESTKQVYADYIDLNEKMDSFTAEASLTTVSNKIRLIEADTVRISVEIMPEIINVVYENLLPYSGSLSNELAIKEDFLPATLELSGEKNLLAFFVPPENIIEIDFSGITEPGIYTLPVLTNIPIGFTLLSLDISEVTVEIIDAPEEDALLLETAVIEGAEPLLDTTDVLIEELE